MTISAIVAKVFDATLPRTSSAYSRVLSAGPILKARSMNEPDTDWPTFNMIVIVILCLLVVAKAWLVWDTRRERNRQVVESADEEMAFVGESYGTMYDDMGVLELKQDIAGADFA